MGVQLLINAGDRFFVSDGTVYTYLSPGALEMLQYEQPSDLVGCALFSSLQTDGMRSLRELSCSRHAGWTRWTPFTQMTARAPSRSGSR